MLEVAGLSLKRKHFALEIPELLLCAGQSVTVIGPSGGGKSSFIRALLGFEPDARFDALRWCGVDLAMAPPHRRPFGWLSQDLGLWPHLTAGEHLAFARTKGRTLSAGPEDRELLERVGLARRLAAKPGALSGGERQRLAFARVFAALPAIALLDEPFSNLDPVTADRMLQEFTRMSADFGIQTIRVTHWMKRPAEDECFWVIEDGSVSQHGLWRELTAQPHTPWIERVVSLHA